MQNPQQEKSFLSKNPAMYVLFIVVAMIIIVVAIGGSSKNQPANEQKTNTKQTQTAKKQEPPKEKIYKINEDVQVGNVRWKLIEVKDLGSTLYASQSKYPTIAQDKTSAGKFVMVSLEVENLSKDLLSVTNINVVDSQGRSYTYSTDASDWIPENKKDIFILNNLQPNLPQQFTTIYEVPADSKGLQLTVTDLKFLGSKSAKIAL